MPRLRPIALVSALAFLAGHASSGLAAEPVALPDAAEKVVPLHVGQPAPAVMLRTIEGEAFDLETLIGQERLALIFYRGGW